MVRLLEKVLQNIPSDYVRYSELCSLLPVTENARYSLIKRSLKEEHLIQLKKGIYIRGNYLQKKKPHPFEMSQQIIWPSYVSLESALSYHQLIPEAVYSTTCVSIRRSSTIENKFGNFSYHKLPKQHFFLGVTRESEHEYAYFIASPWKAIFDYIYCYKKDWKSMTPLIESLRINIDELPKLDIEFANQAEHFYNSKRITRFLKGIDRYYKNEY
jgi:hypothetical protein